MMGISTIFLASAGWVDPVDPGDDGYLRASSISFSFGNSFGDKYDTWYEDDDSAGVSTAGGAVWIRLNIVNTKCDKLYFDAYSNEPTSKIYVHYTDGSTSSRSIYYSYLYLDENKYVDHITVSGTSACGIDYAALRVA